MNKYHNLDSFGELLKYGVHLGWYSGRKRLFNLVMEGEFEGWSGHSSETWEHRFVLTSDLFTGEIVGETLEEVCSKAMKLLSASASASQ